MIIARPLLVENSATAAEKSPATTAAGALASATGTRILIVAADEGRFAHIRARCFPAPSGSDAVHWLAHYETARDALFRESYDVTVLDSHHHGLQLLGDMARWGADTPAIVLVDGEPMSRDAAGVTCEFLSRDALDDGQLHHAIADVVRRSLAARAATRSQTWWRSGGLPVPASPVPLPPAAPALEPVALAPAYSPDHDNRERLEPTPDLNVSRDRGLLTDILDTLPLVAGQLDDDGTILACGGWGLNALGVSAEALRGRNIFALAGISAAAVQPALRGTPVRFVRSWTHAGQTRHFECHLRFDMKRQRGVVGYAYEVTDRVEAERARSRREQRLATVLRQLPGVVGRIDATGQICEVEGSGLNRCGLAPDELLGACMNAIFPAGRSAVTRALAGGTAQFTAATPTGGTDEWHVAFDISFDHESGEGALFIGREVPARDHAEREVLQAVDAERQRIGADLHDEVGQLLTGIACLSTALTNRMRDHDDLAAEDAATIAQVAKDALAHTRAISHGLVHSRENPADLHDGLEALCGQVQRMHGIDLRLHRTGPKTVCDVETSGHVLRIVQEAIANAIRHGHATRIEITVAGGGSKHCVTIKDNGGGFSRRARRQATGSGLGLMEYRAALIGGHLQVTSRPRRGTRIEVTFPPSSPHAHENAC